MKFTDLTINNIGLIGHMAIKLDKPLILFYGEIRQGKSTILNAVKLVFGGEFPQDIIKHGEEKADVTLGFTGGIISREFYRAKDKSTKAKPVTFIRNGRPVPSPVSELKRFLNPFLLDQDFLRNKSETERKAFFAELFAVDTTDLDREWFDNDRNASNLRATIKGYGEIDLTEVAAVDVTKLKAELSQIRSEWEAKKKHIGAQIDAANAEWDSAALQINTDNEANRTHNATRLRGEETLQSIKLEIIELEKKIAALKTKSKATQEWLEQNPARIIKQVPERPACKELKAQLTMAPDTSALESKIQDGAATNVKAAQYQANKKRDEERSAKQVELSNIEARQREIKKEKQAKLKTVSDSCGIADLSFDEAGNFIYQGTEAGMLSTSQIMRLSSDLSALYPEGFGLDLIDRAESLGKSVFEFVERAKKEDKTILATIVGERPATVPENVGVFIVSNGTLQ